MNAKGKNIGYEVYNNEVVRANMPFRDRLINFAWGVSQGGRPATLMKRNYLHQMCHSFRAFFGCFS